MAKFYQKKKPSDLQADIHLLIGEDNGFLVRLKENDVKVEESSVDNKGDLGLVMSKETFHKLISGKWNG